MDALRISIPLAVAFAVAVAATPGVMRLARAVGIIDRPTARTVSRRTDMPLLGGVAVGLGFCAGLAVALQLIDAPYRPQHLTGLFAGGVLMLAAGIYDDRFGMKAWSKFAVQIAAAAIAISYGFEINHLTEPFTRHTFEFPTPVIWVVTTLWIVTITNAVNLVDGLDGLACGMAAIIGTTLTFIAAQAGLTFSFCVGVALVGALLGFLPFNFAPARIFLGDTGSLFIGYVLSLLALESYRQVSLLTFVVPLLALAVPILDTALSVLRRVRLGAPIFSADRLHMHHRLLASEGSARNAVLQFYFLTAAFCLIAVSFTRLQGVAALLFLAAVAALTLRMLWNLGVFSLDTDVASSPEAKTPIEEGER